MVTARSVSARRSAAVIDRASRLYFASTCHPSPRTYGWIVPNEIEAEPFDGLPVAKSAEIDEEYVRVLGVVWYQAQDQFEQVRVGLSTVEHEPEPRLVGDSVWFPPNRRENVAMRLLAVNLLTPTFLVLRIRDAG